MERTKVIIDHTSPNSEADYKKGDAGYIDGYCRGADNKPYAAVVLGNRIVLVPIYGLTIQRG